MTTLEATPFARVSRAQGFAALFVVATITAYFHQIRSVLTLDGWPTALTGLFGISAVVWIALVAMLHFALEGPVGRLRRADLAVLAVGVACCLLPSGWEPRLFLFVAGLYLLLTTNTGDSGRRIAILALALTVPLIWARLAIHFLGPELLALDGAIVGGLLGQQFNGNVVEFTDAAVAASGRQVVILAGCSSFANVSMSVVVMALVSQLLNVPINVRLVLVGLGAALAAIAVNVVRLVMIATLPRHFDFLHLGLGATLFGYASLIAIGVVAIAGTQAARARAAS